MSNVERVGELVAELQTELNRADRAQAESLGVGGAEDLQVLRLLLRDGPQRVGRIAKRRATSMTTASGRLDRLERKGLVSKDRVPDDRRAMVVALTRSGAKAAKTSNTRRLAALEPIVDAVRVDTLESLVDAVRTHSDGAVR